MKKILLTALVAMTLFACSNEDKEGATEGTNLKSLEFTLGVDNPKTRMSDGTVTNGVAAAVRANVKDITLEYFNAGGTSLGTYNFSADDIITVKSDDQNGAQRNPVTIKNIPSSTKQVNVYLNVAKSKNINNLQIPCAEMEYSGEKTEIELASAGTGDNGNDVYSVEVKVKPVLSRFEFKGGAFDILLNMQSISTRMPSSKGLPTGITDGTKEDALKHVNATTIAVAEKSAQEAWRVANPNETDPAEWEFKYTVKYVYNIDLDPTSQYSITSIDGYYMNNIPLTKGGSLVLNANNALGNWNAAALESYKAGGSMEKMFDVDAPAENQNIAYNLFPQATTASATVPEIKAKMPHFILKLTTRNTRGESSTRWLTIRALRNTDASDALITSFEAGKVYVLNASSIEITEYSAILTVTANGTPGKGIPEDKDPTDPNPEPQGKDLEVLVKIAEWIPVNVKPEW